MDPGARFVTFAPLLGIALVMAPFAHGLWSGWKVAGAVVTIVFLGLLTVARLQLGNSFSITPQAKALITGGIYWKIRHPVYVFGAGMIAGLALYLDTPWLLLLLVIVVPLQIVRARREEKVLIETFGKDYVQYKEKTWF